MSTAQKHFVLMSASCDPEGTFNFNIDKKARVGHVTALSFTTSQKELKADIPLKDPENPDNEIKAVAVVDYIEWEGGVTDPIVLSGRISPDNKGAIQEALSAPGGGADVDITFTIYEYDHKAKKYFQRFHTDGKPLKTVLTENTKVFVAEDPDKMIEQPVNFTFKINLTVKSDGGAQELYCAFSSDQKCTRQAGVCVSA